MKRIVSICAARPNFVKLAAVHHAIAALSPAAEDRDPPLRHIIVHTGQHYDPLFSDIFFEQLSIPKPQFNLGVAGGTREEVIERTEKAFEDLLPEIRPDILVVYGDVNGAVGPARVASKRGIPLAHVEAGLRSFDLTMPEELNRMEIDELSQALFCTEQSGVENLQREGAKGFIHKVGNTMIDTLIRMMPYIEAEPMPIAVDGRYAVVTLHRPSNVDDAASLRKNLEFLDELSQQCPLVLPVHHRLKAAIEQFELQSCIPNTLHLLPAQGYVPFLKLVNNSAFILTDSGGIQEEATFLKKRCFTLRKNTERPSTIESGSNTLIDLESPEQRSLVLGFAQSPQEIEVTVPPLWDGKTGERIVQVLREGIIS
jgi:UDP-N-acetylglucosamine 2-epimerase (non-hydrolysing)